MFITRKPPGSPHHSASVLGSGSFVCGNTALHATHLVLKCEPWKKSHTALTQTPDGPKLTRYLTGNCFLPSEVLANDIWLLFAMRIKLFGNIESARTGSQAKCWYQPGHASLLRKTTLSSTFGFQWSLQHTHRKSLAPELGARVPELRTTGVQAGLETVLNRPLKRNSHQAAARSDLFPWCRWPRSSPRDIWLASQSARAASVSPRPSYTFQKLWDLEWYSVQNKLWALAENPYVYFWLSKSTQVSICPGQINKI